MAGWLMSISCTAMGRVVWYATTVISLASRAIYSASTHHPRCRQAVPGTECERVHSPAPTDTRSVTLQSRAGHQQASATAAWEWMWKKTLNSQYVCRSFADARTKIYYSMPAVRLQVHLLACTDTYKCTPTHPPMHASTHRRTLTRTCSHICMHACTVMEGRVGRRRECNKEGGRSVLSTALS